MNIVDVKSVKVRAEFEGRSVEEIVDQTQRESAEAHPVSREKMLEMVRDIVTEDAALLKALAEA
jgi:hypothetical protein